VLLHVCLPHKLINSWLTTHSVVFNTMVQGPILKYFHYSLARLERGMATRINAGVVLPCALGLTPVEKLLEAGEALREGA
jgi:hypothetical protein